MSNIRDMSAVILIGGKAVRMNGIPKFSLENTEGIPYLQLQLGALEAFNKIYLSAADQAQLARALALAVTGNRERLCGVLDEVSGAGPIGGLYSVLKQLKGEWVFVTACDMPGISAEFIEKLSFYLEDKYDCVICQDRCGHIHPLCGYYKKSLVPIIEDMLAKKDYRMMNLLVRGRCRIVDMSEMGMSDRIFDNINTPEELQQHNKRRQQKVFCICGVKNSGKTTYIERLVKELILRGKKIAVIKHDGHDFEGDRPGTDTFRYHEAGAVGTAIFSSQRYMLNRDAVTDADRLINQFPEADLILIEGMKNSEWPKIELIREGISDELSCNRKNLVAVVTDTENNFEETEVWHFDEIVKCADTLLTYTVTSPTIHLERR